MGKSNKPVIKVAGHWEMEWNTPIKEAELWNFLLRDFGIKDWYMWPVTGIKHNEEASVHLHERDTFDQILEENKDLAHVFLEPDNPVYPHNGIDLRKFKHPKKVLYIFGSNHFNPILAYKKKNDVSVTIPTIDNKGVLWPHQCLAILLYDKLVKEGPWQ
jgi:hypothetical protein